MPPLVSRAFAALAATTLALAALPTAARAQKALVYCPVGIDVAGCDRAVAALGPNFPDGVDRAYDGSAGTVDVKTAELWSYAVLVVPSLADGTDLRPYALLRDAAVSERLHDAIMGRVALWSGTPDQGTTNREAKDALIRSLARWAAGNYGTVKGPGLVVFQDLSDTVSARYGWLRALTGVSVTADSAVLSYASVRAMTATGAAIIGADGSAIAYTNMASLGFFLPQGAANVTLDAVGQTGTTKGGQVVLVTSPGGNTGTAVIRTDKDDYAPGTAVTITGTGFQPGETVSMVLHEDPEVHDNRTLTSVADANGAFVNTSFAPEEHDIDVRFILSAVGATSGMRAEATFTDGQPTSVALSPASASVAPGASATYTVNVTMGGNSNACTVTLAVTTALPTGASASFNDNPISLPDGSGSSSFQRTLTIATTNTPPANRTPAGSYPFTVQVSRGTGCQGNGVETTSGTLVVAATTANTTVAVNSASATYPASSVALSATVSSTSTVGVGTVTFTVKQGATTIGSATTSGTVSGGNASVSYALPAGTGAGSYTVEAAYSGGTGFNSSSGTGSLTIGKANQTITFGALAAKTYGDAPFTVSATASSGLPVSFASLTAGTCSVTGTSVTILAAGSCTVAASQAGDGNFNAAPSVNQSFTIDTKSVTPAITADNKQYDGTTAATILTRTLTGVLAADAANVSLTGGTATFADANVGNGKTVTGTGFGLAGSAAGNYALGSTTAVTTANITVRTLTPSVTVASKQYDGNTSAVISGRSLSGALPADAANVTLTGGTASFATRTVGTGKPVSITGLSLSGTAAGNYVLSATTATATADITSKTLVGAITAANKPYDGTTSASASAVTPIAGLVVGDAVTLVVGSASFDDKSVGTGKTVTAGLSLGGADAGNYTVNPTATATASITALGVSPAITASDKVYDGTTTATIASRTVTGAIAGDAVTLTGGTATFASKAVGTAKTVTATGLALGGADAGNYALSPTTATTTADITARSLTVSATGVSKQYDGTTAATVTLGDDRLSGDALSAAYTSATFNNKNVGTAKPVTVSGISISGADAGNYTLASTTASTSADITAKGVVGSFTAADRVYDGTTAATVLTRALSGAIVGDVVSLAGGTATFSDKSVGTSKTVTLAGAALAGADAANYSLGAGAITTTADITPRTVTAQITAGDKIYDGNTSATITSRSLADAVAGDVVSLSGGAASFDTKSVGTGKTVTATGLGLTGGDAGNYLLSGAPVTTTADITARALVVSATGIDRVYDGTTAATVTLSDDRVSGDVLTAAYAAASFASKTVGTGKTVSVTGISISGADAGNYSANTSASTTASITPRPLTVTATAQNKVYDATTAATASLATDKLAADAVAAASTSATFDTKNVGTGKTVTVSGLSLSGADASNYALASTTATTTADITAKGITGSITASNKVYDGTTAATITTRSLAGVLASDVVSYVGGTATFASRTVGTGKTVTGTGLSLDGADAGNYTVNTTATTTADITPLAITGSITASNKVYDGTTAAAIATRTLSGQVAGDAVSYTGGTATFADANAGTGKTVTATGLGLTGTDAGNYTVNTTAVATADITKAQPLFANLSSPTIIQGEISTTLTGKIAAGLLVPPGAVTVSIDGASAPLALGGGSGAPLTTTATIGADGSFSATFSTAALVPPSYNISYSYTESANFKGQAGSGVLTVTPNAKPVITVFSAPITPTQVGTGVPVAVTFTDADPAQSAPYRVSINWGDGSPDFVNSAVAAPGTINTTKTYSTAGVYRLTATVSDKITGNTDTKVFEYVVIYDPSAGFVTGGGWINSPVGAYAANVSLSGKATFGFVSKYQKGATTPTGNTQFQFHAGGFDFKSTVYEWLVVSGARGQYKGSGTINGSGDYGFILTAVDGQAPGGGGTDFFRIKVFDKSTSAVVYDNMAGSADDATPGPSSPGTILGGGSIQIQSK